MTMQHTYTVRVEWTGNTGTGTAGHRSYARAHEITARGLPAIQGSADPAFHGDPSRWNPEQLLLAALAQCHLMSYLYFCAADGVVVTAYTDQPVGTLTRSGVSGQFSEAVLHPVVEVAEAGMVDRALALHTDANRACFIANSVNFPVHHRPVVTVRAGA
ncbi:OsmC family protein [Kitasatospora sp. NPDC002040]|uniref:OsmC family protein n=1 Tax=Kitasatospora sp. NPDC002040 TaxID=3154661 RepID=UPI00331F4E82